MRDRLRSMLLGAVATLVLASCAAQPTQPPGDPVDAPGTPVGGPNLVEADAALMWSNATNELIGQQPIHTAGFTVTAVHSVTGSPRTLDTLGAFFLPQLATFTAGDSTLLYNALDSGDFSQPDSVQLRAITVAGASDVTVLIARPVISLFFVVASPGRPNVAFSAADISSGVDSIRVVDLSTGSIESTDPGVPLAFSPDGTQLLFRSGPIASFGASPRAISRALRSLASASKPQAYIYSLVNKTAVPISLGIPPVVSGSVTHWGDDGIEVLYVEGARSLYHRNATTGTTRFLWQAPDSLDAPSLTWSNDGTKAAFWTVAPTSGGESRFSIYVIDIESGNAARLAYAVAQGGGITFSPDQTRLAYVYGYSGETRIYTSQVPSVWTRASDRGTVATGRAWISTLPRWVAAAISSSTFSEVRWGASRHTAVRWSRPSATALNRTGKRLADRAAWMRR